MGTRSTRHPWYLELLVVLAAVSSVVSFALLSSDVSGSSPTSGLSGASGTPTKTAGRARSGLHRAHAIVSTARDGKFMSKGAATSNGSGPVGERTGGGPTSAESGAPGNSSSLTWVVPNPGGPAPTPCRPSDMSVSTSTDKSSYTSGEAIVVTTTLRAERSTCQLALTPADGAQCASYVVVTDSAGNQVWPEPGQPVTCGVPGETTVEPGDGETVTDTWYGQTPSGAASAGGRYIAYGVWSWSAGEGQPPYVVEVPAEAFVVD